MHAHPIAEDASEIKTPRKRRPHEADPWYKRYPRDFQDDTRELKPDERGLYNDILDLIYMAGGPVPDDDRTLAHRMHVHIETWRKIRRKLLAKGKLFLTNGHLMNKRAKEVLATRAAERVAMGQRGGQPPSDSWATQGELFKKSNDSNAPRRASSQDVDVRVIEVETEDDSVARAREAGLPPKLTPQASAVLVRLDDHRPVLIEKHYDDFRGLCDTFGRKAGEMVIAPTPRDTSDDLLEDLVRSELGECPQHIAQRAIDAALRAAKAATLTNRQNGRAGKSAGGISALLRYLEHAVRSQATNIQIADASALAKMHTEKTVQTKVANKRLDGVARGGGGAKKRGSSWDEIGSEMGWDTDAAQEA